MQSEDRVGIQITYPDGSAEFIDEAVTVDTQNFHEGMFDFYDARGTLLRQIGMSSNIRWELVTRKGVEDDDK